MKHIQRWICLLLVLVMTLSSFSGALQLTAAAAGPETAPVSVKLEENQLTDIETDLTNLNGNNIACDIRKVGGCSGGQALMFQPGREGTFFVQMKFPTPAAGAYKMYLGSKTYDNRGMYDVTINGTKIGQVDGYGSGSIKEFEIGTVEFSADQAQSVLRFDSAGKNPAAQGVSYSLIVDYIRFEPVTQEMKLEESALTLGETNLEGINGTTVVCQNNKSIGGCSGGQAFMFQPGKQGEFYVELSFARPKADTYKLVIGTKRSDNRGIYGVQLDGKNAGELDGYGSGVAELELGMVEVAEGQEPCVLRFTSKGKNPASKGEAYGLIVDYIRLIPAEQVVSEEIVIYAADGKPDYAESGAVWEDADAAWGPEGHPGRISTDAKAVATFSRYEEAVPGSWNYELQIYHPQANKDGAVARYTIQTGGGMWIFEADQSRGDGWVKLGVITVVGNTSTEIALSKSSGKTLFAGGVKLIPTSDQADANATPGGGTATDPAILVNQSGYDYGASKQATVVNIPGDTPFYVKDVKTKEVLFEGKVQDMSWSGTLYDNTNSTGEVRSVQGGIVDFTAFNPEQMTECYLECGTAVSFPFVIAKNWMQRVSLPAATDFMEQVRSDYGTDPGWLQYGWRDSHQFSYELPSLVLQYMSNPSYYNHQPYDVWRAKDCMYEDLRVQDEPNLVWLMKFGMERYYDIRFRGDLDPDPDRAKDPNQRPYEVSLGNKYPWGNGRPGPIYLHGMIKEQMAYVLYIYPQISQWMDKAEYLKYRDFLLSEWAEPRCSMSFHAISGEKHNLFETQTVVGNLKGGFPPAHSVVPNLMMYEVVKRDMEDPTLVTDTLKAADAEKFFDAAYRNCEYVLEHFPMDAPRYSKGQRMNEHLVMENMAWFQEMYPDRAPKLLLPAIERWADKMIARSDNLWGAHMASAVKAGDSRDYWTGSALDQQEIHGFNNNTLNEPGNLAGFQAAALAAARVIRDPVKQEQLRNIGTWSIDGMFGRNPYGRTIFFSCTRTVQPDGTPDYKDRNTDLIIPGHEQEIEGTDLGWMERDTRIGSGVLAIARGRIDASPKEWAYPYNPNSPGGYKEGWVTYNTAWNASLAYAAADQVAITAEASGNRVHVVLTAPNNLDYNKQEFVEIDVTDLTTGAKSTMRLMEDGVDGLTFSGDYEGTGSFQNLRFSYGYGIFCRSAEAVLSGSGFVPVTEIRLEQNELCVVSGQTFQVPVQAVLPEHATNKAVTWTCSDPDAIRVLKDGSFLAMRAGGPYTLTASCAGSEAQARCSVTVEEAAALELVLDAPKQMQAETQAQVTVQGMRMADGTLMQLPAQTNVTWTLDDYSKANVSETGSLFAKRSGKAVVTATAVYKEKAISGTCQVEIQGAMDEGQVFEFEKKTASGYERNDNVRVSPDSDNAKQCYAVHDRDTDVLLFKPTKGGEWVELTNLPLEPGHYLVKLGAKKTSSYGYGVYDAAVDGEKIAQIDFGEKEEWYTQHELAMVQVTGEGPHSFRLTVQNGTRFNSALNNVTFFSVKTSYGPVNLDALQEQIEAAEALEGQLDETVLQALAAAKELRDETNHPDQAAIDAGTQALKDALEQFAHNNQDQAAAMAVDQQIEALGDITLESEAAIAAAREAYSKLTDAQQKLVTKISILEAAEKRLQELKDEAQKPVNPEKPDNIPGEHENNIPVKPDKPEAPAAPQFADVRTEDYFYDAVNWAVENGITAGTGADRFSPDAICTRAQAVTFLWRAAGQPRPAANALAFTDVAADAYYRDAVLWAVEQGITAGTAADRFSPDAPCSRAQIVTFLWRSAGKPEAAQQMHFADVKTSDFFAEAVQWAAAEGITTGTGAAQFSPDAACSRAQIVTFLYRQQS